MNSADLDSFGRTMNGTLYIVATPIGNLEDVTLRALRILQEVAIIAAEDTRTTRKLLTHYDIHTPLVSYNDHNYKLRIPYLLKQLEISDVALVSEAGTPAISDPGRDLVLAADGQGVRVIPIPGASAIPTALAVAGMPTGSFYFLGFLPRRRQDRKRLLEGTASCICVLVAFETPHRLRSALDDALTILGDRRVIVCRELTKLYEEIFRGTLSEALTYFTEPRGEITLVIEGASESNVEIVSEEVLRAAVTELRDQGLPPGKASSQVAKQYGIPRGQVYKISLK
jgi:16S rRNA (cytidine1402-2'-O)-methyltransferase